MKIIRGGRHRRAALAPWLAGYRGENGQVWIAGVISGEGDVATNKVGDRLRFDGGILFETKTLEVAGWLNVTFDSDKLVRGAEGVPLLIGNCAPFPVFLKTTLSAS